MTRTKQRTEFLGDILVGAIENYGYGWFSVDTYHIPEDNPGAWFADIIEDDGDGQVHHVDLRTIAKGLSVIRYARVDVVATRTRMDGSEYNVPGYVNEKTGQPLYMGEKQRANILLSDRTNGEDGDMDVIDYLAVLECAIFGAVTYA